MSSTRGLAAKVIAASENFRASAATALVVAEAVNYQMTQPFIDQLAAMIKAGNELDDAASDLAKAALEGIS